MSRLTHYRFQSTWHLDAPPADVFAVLHDQRTYPVWWPEIREAEPSADGGYRLRARSLLPYYLDFDSDQSVDDHDRMVLEARMHGDLEGFSRWTVEPEGAGTK